MSTKLIQAGCRDNALLAALPKEEWRRLAPHMTQVELARGEIIGKPRAKASRVYFPAGSIISSIRDLADGHIVTVAMIGNTGLFPTVAVIDNSIVSNRAIVQSAGSALYVPASVVREEFARGGVLQHLLVGHCQALLAQMAQTIVCMRYHTIQQQFCRWLLMCLDRLPPSRVSMTHEALADILGVRRVSVTTVAVNLQRAGVIRYSRGQIEVVDRLRLESLACECYRMVKEEYARLKPWTVAT